MMYSLMKQYHIDKGEANYTVITLTARAMDNDINGTPRYKVHVWLGGIIWAPTIKGFKRCKDDSYTIKGYDTLPDMLLEFVQTLEVSINE